ncbi:histone-lysine N-methyltransferase SETMAR-like [Halictus rubicundus]|uniref:histone-lysine N-methyltransferase SETMAR-like n=1 Tax=Halictus rubicundus TaxID=77578 RepID=UPI00403749B5
MATCKGLRLNRPNALKKLKKLDTRSYRNMQNSLPIVEVETRLLLVIMISLTGLGRPVEFDNDTLKSLVEADPKLSIQELSRSLGSTWSTIQRHLNEMGKAYRPGIWVPHQLSEINKNIRRSICTSLLSRFRRDPFLSRIVTGDEKWILYDNIKRSKQWLSANRTAISTPKPSLSLRNVLLCLWWDCRGIIHFELLKPGETVTAELYCQQLQRLYSELLKKRTSLVHRKGVILQIDNARPHTAKLTQEKIKELQWEVLPHPLYSPDIAPSDLFRSLEHYLRNKTFCRRC